jgi:hypothetical protein
MLIRHLRLLRYASLICIWITLPSFQLAIQQPDLDPAPEFFGFSGGPFVPFLSL